MFVEEILILTLNLNKKHNFFIGFIYSILILLQLQNIYKRITLLTFSYTHEIFIIVEHLEKWGLLRLIQKKI